VSTPASAAEKRSLQKEWWLLTLGVLRSPAATFRAMRETSKQAAEAREEPVLLLILLAGIAAILAFSSTSREFLDDSDIDGALIPILVFLAGAIYGFAGYWIGGAALYLGIRGAKGEATYRQARHLLAYALVPLAASLVVVWPIRLAVFGGDSFRSGGSDEGAGNWVFTGLTLVFAVWSLTVLVIGVRAFYGWTTMRSVGALLVTMLALSGIAVLGVAVGGF
jgi:hypothetical protein